MVTFLSKSLSFVAGLKGLNSMLACFACMVRSTLALKPTGSEAAHEEEKREVMDAALAAANEELEEASCSGGLKGGDNSMAVSDVLV